MISSCHRLQLYWRLFVQRRAVFRAFSFVLDTVWHLLDIPFPQSRGKVRFSEELCVFSYLPLSVNLIWLHSSSGVTFSQFLSLLGSYEGAHWLFKVLLSLSPPVVYVAFENGYALVITFKSLLNAVVIQLGCLPVTTAVGGLFECFESLL